MHQKICVLVFPWNVTYLKTTQERDFYVIFLSRELFTGIFYVNLVN